MDCSRYADSLRLNRDDWDRGLGQVTGFEGSPDVFDGGARLRHAMLGRSEREVALPSRDLAESDGGIRRNRTFQAREKCWSRGVGDGVSACPNGDEVMSLPNVVDDDEVRKGWVGEKSKGDGNCGGGGGEGSTM